MKQPQRIQRKRTKGWKMPPNTVYVGRPTKWGNPFIASSDPENIGKYSDWKKNVDLRHGWPCRNRATAVYAYRKMVASRLRAEDVKELKGKNLACWCPLGQPCHAVVLLEIANS